ncbi:TPA: leu operon leader peptide, partial [Escherichia coli]|nr:leu operon leader peptide [Escherichia coli]HBC6825338.1 leu operon leader peptide [Escherichia coli]
ASSLRGRRVSGIQH